MAAQLSPLSLEEFHERYDGAKPAYEYWYGTAWTLTSGEGSPEPWWVSTDGALRIHETAIALTDIFAKVDLEWESTGDQD
jgi:hypothetical protein